MKPGSVSPLRVATTLALALSLLLLAFIATGRVQIVVSSGSSMEPAIEVDDLAILRPQERYEIGDVVAYTDPDLGTVLHRIIDRIEDGGRNRYVVKGDANDFVDSLQPTDAEIIGRAAALLPNAGRVVGLLPLLAASGLVIYWIVVGSRPKSADAPASRNRQTASPPLAVAGRIAVVLGLAGALIALIAPTERNVRREVPYETEIDIEWRAEAAQSVVYPDGTLEPSDPIFRSEIDEVGIDVSVRAPANAQDVSGNVSLMATFSDGSGWSTTRDLATNAPIRAGAAKLMGNLDLIEISDLAAEVGSRTGFASPSQNIELRVAGSIAGEVGGRPFTQVVDHVVSMTLDDVRLAPDPGEAWSTDLPGTVIVEETSRRVVSLGALELSLSVARAISLALVVGGGFLMMRYRRSALEEHELINQVFAGFVMPATTVALPSDASLVDVTDFEDLLRIAQIEGSPILELENDGIAQPHQWLTVSLGIWYRYRITQATLVRNNSVSLGAHDEASESPDEAASAPTIVSVPHQHS